MEKQHRSSTGQKQQHVTTGTEITESNAPRNTVADSLQLNVTFF
jgi:hypothetical protein